MNRGVDIAAGEEVFFPGPIPVKVELTARCHCGGQMIPDKRKPLTWICDRSHWWNRRRRHAYLQGRIDVLPMPKGNA